MKELKRLVKCQHSLLKPLLSRNSVIFDKEEHDIENEQDSMDFASGLAQKIQPGDVAVFSGDLGAGKTFLCREIIKCLCGQDTNVTSPTFNLLQTYECGNYSIYHYDLYRLKHISEIYELGIEEAFSGNISLIEWPELIDPMLTENSIYINISIINYTQRKISINQR